MDQPKKLKLEFVLNTLPESIARDFCEANGICYKEACKQHYEIRSYNSLTEKELAELELE